MENLLVVKGKLKVVNGLWLCVIACKSHIKGSQFKGLCLQKDHCLLLFQLRYSMQMAFYF